MIEKNITHSELCIIAANWLKTKFNCRIVLIEPHAYTTYNEIPDVIGWVGGKCIVVECKTSIADFNKDQKKIFRSAELSDLCIGNWRFYFTNGDFLKNHNIPKGWGYYFIEENKKILFCKGEKYASAKKSPFPSRPIDEVYYLLHGVDKMKKCFYNKIDKKIKISNKIIF